MKNLYLIACAVVLIFQSCKTDDDCGSCFTPPQNFVFEFVDADTKENLFTNETYDPDQLQIFNTLNADAEVNFVFIAENALNLVNVNSIGWETETVNLKMRLAGNDIFTLYVDAERKDGECCSYTEYNEVKIEGSAFELNAQTGVYTIFVEKIW